MEIRLAQPRDLAAIRVLWDERHTILGEVDPRWRSARLRGDVIDAWLMDDAYRLYVGERDARGVIGYCVGQVAGDGNGLILDLGLDAHGYHGGLGRQLVQAVRAALTEAGVSRIVIQTARADAIAQAFWRGVGAVALTDDQAALLPEAQRPEVLWMQFVSG